MLILVVLETWIRIVLISLLAPPYLPVLEADLRAGSKVGRERGTTTTTVFTCARTRMMRL